MSILMVGVSSVSSITKSIVSKSIVSFSLRSLYTFLSWREGEGDSHNTVSGRGRESILPSTSNVR